MMLPTVILSYSLPDKYLDTLRPWIPPKSSKVMNDIIDFKPEIRTKGYTNSENHW